MFFSNTHKGISTKLWFPYKKSPFQRSLTWDFPSPAAQPTTTVLLFFLMPKRSPKPMYVLRGRLLDALFLRQLGVS